jgi:hypothetical protein
MDDSDAEHRQVDPNRRPPTLTEEDKDWLAQWLAAYPMIGIYVAQNDSLVSINHGAEARGGRDIQERMPPDLTPDGDERTAPPFTPSGDYLYINDRNAPVRYDRRGAGIPVSISARSLGDIAAAPATQCQGNNPVYGVEGTGRGRIVISGNNVLSIFDSDLGRMDFSASNGCRLR